MEITFIGHACFKIKGKDLTIVTDPYNPEKTGYKISKQKADLVLSSHDHFDHNNLDAVSDYKMAITTAGEYEVEGVYIEGIPTFHDEQEGAERGLNTMYQITMDDMNLLHMGDLGHELKKDTLERILDVDVLMIPVGGTYTINAKTAAKVISTIEPGVVIPMHYQTKDLTGLSKELDPVKKFLEEMGDENIKEIDKFKISKNSIPEETEIVVLTPTH
jgi:L-ascorbate metabolism protein UlaG (beta-lactamase superfamily)